MDFKKVNWNDDKFSKWLRKIGPSWTSKRENNILQYICKNEVVAMINFQNIYNFEKFGRVLRIREDLINVPERE